MSEGRALGAFRIWSDACLRWVMMNKLPSTRCSFQKVNIKMQNSLLVDLVNRFYAAGGYRLVLGAEEVRYVCIS
jgi:hypothetical protein